jgi:hypothetical protein
MKDNIKITVYNPYGLLRNNLSVCLITVNSEGPVNPVYAIKTSSRSRFTVLLFFTSVLDRGKWPVSRSGRSTSRRINLLSLEEEACCNPEKCGRFGREGRLFYMP